MSKPPPISRIEELRAAVSKADPHTYLVEARVMRRLIRGLLDRPNLAMLLPHGQSQILSKEQVQTLTHPDELGIRSWDLFPDLAILIEQPTQEELEHWPIEDLKLQVSRRLFHALLDRELLRFKAPDQLSFIQARIDAVGQVEFDEAHHVLRSELRLLQPDSRVGAFCEWVAHFWEFKKFEPDSLSTWFPSISSNAHVQESLRLGLDIEGLYRGSHLVGSAQPDTTDHEAQDEEVLKNTRKGWIFEFGNAASERKYLRYMRRRDRSIDKGNTVRAITSDLRAARVAPSRSKHAKAESMAESDLRLFVKRLREAIGFSHEESIEWQHVLGELAQNAVQGFWNAEKRLLYDLQKVCLDKERVVYRIDLLRWLASGGKRPLRTPLLNLSEVQMAKHLASAASRLVHVRLSGIEREQLTHLLENAAHQAELQMRNRIRGPLRETLLDVGMVPTTFPEKIALNKLVEDALDCISERGYISMGYFRDAVSKNDLKLPDLNGFREAWSGDRLLKADERLDRVLEGVYRRGDFYLRWIQMISAMFFGTKLGRFQIGRAHV